MATLTVGSGQEFTTIESAVAAAKPGDTIDVMAGIYTNDFVGIYKNLTLQAVGGPVQLVATAEPPNGKAIIDEGGSGIAVTLNGFDISGAVVPDGNGAAIRYEGGSLLLNHDYIHNNQDGLLAASDPNGTITIDNSEFAFNGAGDGRTHNIYVNNIALLTIDGSYFHDANVGHEIKSRAQDTVVTNSRIFDNNGTASYSIDLPNGGDATIENDVIEQGPNTQNPYIIAYGEEGNLHSGTSALVADNVIVNDLPQSGSPKFLLNRTTTQFVFRDNQVYGLTVAEVASGPLDEVNPPTFLATRPTLDTSSTWSDGLLCFLAGTKISTPTQEVRVEDLVVGDAVRTLGGQQTIIWIGRSRLQARRRRRGAATPVIVCKGALADGVPHSDLRVTKGHALHIDGALIPVEFLVNHRSILWDDFAQEVEIFHIELATHDVLLANGAPAESYRDDGNRWLFRNADTGDAQPMKPTCAPLLTGGTVVDTIWRRLLERAGPRPGFLLTDDPDLHLLVDGNRVDAFFQQNLRFFFRFAETPRTIRIMSHAGAPQELGLARDSRLLGVALRRIVMAQATRVQVIDADDERLTEGFYEYEADGNLRWSSGDAMLPEQLLTGFTGPMVLTIDVCCTTRYPVDRVASEAA